MAVLLVVVLVVVLGPIGLIGLMGRMCPKHEYDQCNNELFEQGTYICSSNQFHRNIDLPGGGIAILHLFALHQP